MAPGGTGNSIVGEHLRRLLTDKEDKEDAMAALCQRFEKRTSFMIKRGIPLKMANEQTSRGVLWIMGRALNRYRRSVARTWSWLRVNGPVMGEIAWSQMRVYTRHDLTKDLQALENDRLRVKATLKLASMGSKMASLGLKTYDEYVLVAQRLDEYQAKRQMQKHLTCLLNCDDDGWVSTNRWEEVLSRYRLEYSRFVESVLNTERCLTEEDRAMAAENAAFLWPYDQR